MAKRKADSESAEDDYEESEEEKPKSKRPTLPSPSPSKTVKKPRVSKSADDDDGGEPSTTKEKSKSKSKKSKSEKRASTSSGAGAKVQRGADGEKYIDLGKKRRAAVKQFKNSIYLDIREFYGDDGDEKPGKKGITLQQEQWEALKNSAADIDALFAEIK